MLLLLLSTLVASSAPDVLSCTWDSAKGMVAHDAVTACKAMQPGISSQITARGLHRSANVTHIDIQTVLYRTEAALVAPKKSRISVAAIPAGGCNGCSIDKPGNGTCGEQLALIELAGARGADVAVLPEEFLWDGKSAPPADCDLSDGGQGCKAIRVLGAIAKKHGMYIVFGMRAAQPKGDPYPADPGRPKAYGKLGYNTDVILGRDGKMVGYYRKAWPCCTAPDGSTMDDGYPSRELVKTFDLDFGRVGLQTCFDMNFDDTWHQLYAANVDIVFWPSAYGGGLPIRGYSQLYHYNIVPVGWGDITDITGQVAEGLHAVVPKKMYMATLDLDHTYTHDDFIGEEVQKLVADHKGLVEFLYVPEHCSVGGQCSKTADLVRESGFYLLGRTDKGYEQGVSVRALLQKYNIETLRQYQHRSRAAINMQRQAAAPHPRVLKRDNRRNGLSRRCAYDANLPTKSSPDGSNSTCEPLVSDASTTVTLTPTAGADSLGDVLYADTRTTIYTAPPALTEPKKSRIKVASIAGIKCCVPASKVNSSLALAITKLELAAKSGADVALLPEEFMCGNAACSMDIDGPEVHQLMAVAKKLAMWIVFGMRATAPAGDPYPVDPARGDGKKLGYNTDVILDRQGEMVGYYRKSWPCCPGPNGTTMDDGYPSRELVKTFDTEFGRIGLQTCFDMNFMDTWHELYAQHVDIVFWPSAYGGGMPIRAYAKLFHYNIVPAGWGDITDVTGRVAEGQQQEPPGSGIFTTVLDLDRTLFHTNFNQGVAKLLADHKGDVEKLGAPGYCSTPGNCSAVGDILGESSFILLGRTNAGYAKGVSVRALKEKYGLTDLSTYQHQSRHALNMQRMTASPNTVQWPYNINGSNAKPKPPHHYKCCWNRDTQPCNSSSQCDRGGEGCVLSGTVTKKYGMVTCSVPAPAAMPADLAARLSESRDAAPAGPDLRFAPHQEPVSTEPEPRNLVHGGHEFVKAEGSRGWRGVPDTSEGL